MPRLAILGGRPLRERPWAQWPYHDEAEREAARRVADSGRWQSGPEVEAFERQFAAYCQAKHALCAMNGTVTMEIGLFMIRVCCRAAAETWTKWWLRW